MKLLHKLTESRRRPSIGRFAGLPYHPVHACRRYDRRIPVLMSGSSQAAQDPHARAWVLFAEEAAGRLARFERNLEQPGVAQADVFREVIAYGANSAFGRAYGFAEITTLKEYRDTVPVSRWSDVAPWIERAQGESEAVLTAEAPLHFERTSGSTSRTKDIPYTPALLSQFQRAIVVWLAKLYEECPEVAGPAWWSLSPDRATPARAANGIPIGSASDAVYLQGSAAEALLTTMIDTQSSLASAHWKTEMLAIVAANEDLALISVWSPTFLSALLGMVVDEDKRAAGLKRMQALLTGRRYRALIDAVETQEFSRLWPRLRVISAWTDGPSEHYAARIAKLFPQAKLVPKGLFATEGIVSLSWGLGEARPLAIESHFMEFLDADGGLRLAEELDEGRRYEPVLTTTGGLYRYALGDRWRKARRSARDVRIQRSRSGGAGFAGTGC
jgi:hypothetical protein